MTSIKLQPEDDHFRCIFDSWLKLSNLSKQNLMYQSMTKSWSKMRLIYTVNLNFAGQVNLTINYLECTINLSNIMNSKHCNQCDVISYRKTQAFDIVSLCVWKRDELLALDLWNCNEMETMYKIYIYMTFNFLGYQLDENWIILFFVYEWLSFECLWLCCR